MRDARFDRESFDIATTDEPPVRRWSVMGSRALAMGLLLMVLLLACGCERPLYQATPDGTALTSWETNAAVTPVGEPFNQEVRSKSGAGYRVEARAGTYNGKTMPAQVKVQLTTNPAGAEVQVQCDQATHFEGDPLELLTTLCKISELTGTKGLLGTKAHQRVAFLHVKGNGKVVLQEPQE